tara:strand:- start:6507 stop:7613 length:1107 start_codon:yes stop_codon:yes gene_type:complete
MNPNQKKLHQLEQMFQVIGSPFLEISGSKYPSTQEIDDLFEFSFENRVGLLFLDKCRQKGIELSEKGSENLQKLEKRRSDTDDILIKLGKILDEVHAGEWVYFKTLKPFPSTPNDTDWFPFDERDHSWLCDHLLKSGFKFLEWAPLQTTLIDESGDGQADSDKRGGVWYIDCYRAPGADYFKYLDPAKMEKYKKEVLVNGHKLPGLESSAELSAICFHNVFPERTYSVETFYLILHYLKDIEANNKLTEFVKVVRENHVTCAVSANLAVTKALHEKHFGSVPPIFHDLLKRFNARSSEEKSVIKTNHYLPYNFQNSCFWICFLEKLKDPVSFKSLWVQAIHMLNPAFAWGALKIIWKRTRPGAIYKQM